VFVVNPDGSEYYFDRFKGAVSDAVHDGLRARISQDAQKIRTWSGSPFWFTLPDDHRYVYLSIATFRYSIPEFVGIITAGVPLSYFESQYSSYHTIGSGTLFVFNRVGQLIYGDENGLTHIARQALTGIATPDYRGTTLQLSYPEAIATAIRPAGQLLSFVTVVRRRDLLKGIVTIQQTLLVTGSLAALIAFLLAWVLSTGITRDLGQVAGSVQLISAGNLNQKVYLRRRDEIGELAGAFNSMIDRLTHTIGELTEEKASKHEAELRAVEAEYRALQASVDPHFLNNILESINGIAKMNGQEKISRIVTSLSHVLRKSISVERRFVSLQAELEYVRNYLELQAAVSDRRVTASFEIEPAARTCLVPKLILQPVVENAMKYGLADAETDGVLSIVAYREDGLHIIVSDNGRGMSRAKLQKARTDAPHPAASRARRGGFGIRSVRRRMQLLYGDRAKFSISSRRMKGTRVELIFPEEEGNTRE
jgi:two-component system sensor histidine kinase YesM